MPAALESSTYIILLLDAARMLGLPRRQICLPAATSLAETFLLFLLPVATRLPGLCEFKVMF